MPLMSHPDLDAAPVNVPTVEAFRAAWEHLGWELVDENATGERVPTGHIPHTQIHPAELSAGTVTITGDGDDDPDDDGEPVDLTRPEED